MGPLSVASPIAETPWGARQRAMRRNDEVRVGSEALTEEMALLMALSAEIFVPRDREARDAVKRMQRQAESIQSLAPYSIASIQNGIAAASDEIGLCSRPPGEMWPCFVGAPARQAGRVDPPFEIDDEGEGVYRIIIRDLSDAENPGWQAFGDAVRALSTPRGLVIDMKSAWGADPRPLLPWLESVTGRSPLHPILEIRRPSSLRRFVASYQARYRTEVRSQEVWDALVGTSSPASSSPAAFPIAVVVGPDCESACELIARVLQTYAAATVTGGVRPNGRLHRDEPAMLTLPHSGISLYFFAAEYRLADEIEAATGPTGRWQSGIDPLEEDGVDYALREVRARARLGGPWPSRCDAHAVYSKWSEMPANGQQKLEGEHALTCQWTPLIILVSDAPFSALRRFLDTCPEELELRRFLPGQHLLEIRTREETDMALSRILQSELIQQARIECEPPPMLDQN